MKAIVTGSEGFIGKALCSRLKKKGFEVVRIDTKTGGDAARIEPLLDGSVDVVYHLAAETSVFNDQFDKIVRENISAFITVALACASHDVKLVYASSSTANGCNTTSLYGISKYLNERFAKAYCPTATGVRFHNVYGSSPRKGTLLYNLINNEECTIFNGGRNLRHFTHIDDAVEGLIFAYTSDKQLVNVRNPECITVRRFCKEVEKYKPLKLHYTDDLRPLDNFEQSVNEDIFSVPLHYKTVAEGLSQCFEK